MDGVRDVLRSRGLSLEEGMRRANDRDVWRRMVYVLEREIG